MRSHHYLGQRYLLVVTDHDTRRLVWADKDRTAATLRQFFDDLARTGRRALTHVSANGAEFIHTVVTERARKPCCAWMPSLPGPRPPRPLMRSAVGWPPSRAAPDAPIKPLRSRRPGGRRGKTHPTSPPSSAPHSSASKPATARSIAPTCSKNNFA
jgi:Transposase